MMKNHKYVNGQLIHTNKTFDMLKQSQKEKITKWMYETYKKHMNKISDSTAKEVDTIIVEEVISKIAEAEIWLPNREIYIYYQKKKNQLKSRLEKEK